MTNKLMDIKESDTKIVVVGTSTEIRGILEYTISRQPGSIGQDLTVVLPKVESTIAVGDRVYFKGVEWVVTSRQIRAAYGGFVSVLSAVSLIGELIRKAPLKTLMYMSMTQEEKDEFEVSCEGDYGQLDYIPLIRICDPVTFTGGWNSHDVIHDLLFRRAGFNVVCNVYNFWVRQVNASNTSSYFETVMSLVGFLRPIVYDQDGVIYIIDRPLENGAIEVNKIVQLSQTSTFSFDSKTKYFRVTGGYGKWIREKSKIKAMPETEARLVSETYQEKPMLLTVKCTGDAKIINRMRGRVTSTYEVRPSVEVSSWLKEPMRERYTTTETWRLDPLGNYKALLSRHTVGRNLTLGVTVLDKVEEYGYEFLTEEFDRPRLVSRKTTVGKYAWVVVDGIVSVRQYKGKVEEISESWVYSENGTLLQETYTKSMDCVKLQVGDEWVTIDMADKFWREEGSQDTVDVQRMVVEEKVTTYRQLTPDLYEMHTIIRRLGSLARRVGEETYSTVSTVVRGRVPRHPLRYRKMIVEYDNIPDAVEHDSIDVPVMTISNPNIIDWADAEVIFNKLKMFAAESNVTTRVISIPSDIPIDIGWKMNLPAFAIGNKLERPAPGAPYEAAGQYVPAVDAPNYIRVTGYEKRKNAAQPYIETVVTVEAR